MTELIFIRNNRILKKKILIFFMINSVIWIIISQEPEKKTSNGIKEHYSIADRSVSQWAS